MTKALKELDFYYGKKVGDAQSALSKILDGKEVSANSIEQVKELSIELQRLVSYAKAQKDNSFQRCPQILSLVTWKRR